MIVHESCFPPAVRIPFQRLSTSFPDIVTCRVLTLAALLHHVCGSVHRLTCRLGSAFNELPSSPPLPPNSDQNTAMQQQIVVAAACLASIATLVGADDRVNVFDTGSGNGDGTSEAEFLLPECGMCTSIILHTVLSEEKSQIS